MRRLSFTGTVRRAGYATVVATAVISALSPAPASALNLFDRLDQDVGGKISDLAADAREKVAYYLGMEAYAYGLPLVLMDATKGVLTAAAVPATWSAPINQFTRAKAYVSPDMTNVVRISLNGLWATAFLDLSEPIIVSVPAAGDRSYVGQVMNMWTDNFASIGPRSTGAEAGNYMIVGPGWNGETPEAVKAVYRSSTRYAWILFQTIAQGPADFPAAYAFQANYQLTPLGAWGKPYQPPATVAVDPTAVTDVTPFDQVRLMDAQTYFNRLAQLMVDNPPYAADKAILEKLAKLGVEPGKPFDLASVDPGIGRGMTRAVADIWGKLATGPLSMTSVNGWINPLNLGAYGTDYNTRAAVAWLGLGALSKQDAIYPSAFLDGEGRPLDFTAKYVMRFPKDQMLPCGAAWSISIYEGNFYDANPENKYDVAPWMQPKIAEDGSMTIYIQPESPGEANEANWLPSPDAGPMNITIRCYAPEPTFLDGTYEIPPIELVR